jgi:hypothetical protein
MKIYFLTNTSSGFIHLLNERKISYRLTEDRPGGMFISLPSDQDLFMLAQDYEQRREELNKMFPNKG